MRDDKIICNCRNITFLKIKKAIENGAKSFDEVQKITGVSKSCGKCMEYAKSVVEDCLSNR